MQERANGFDELLQKLETAGRNSIDPALTKGIIKTLESMATSVRKEKLLRTFYEEKLVGPVYGEEKLLGTFYLCDQDEVQARLLWTLYDEALAEIRREWGDPLLKGEGPNFERRALHLNAWIRDDFRWVVMVTGHDVNTVYCVSLEVSLLDRQSRSPSNWLERLWAFLVDLDRRVSRWP
jgi:hypothetical protein